MQSRSVWLATTPGTNYPELTRSVEVDVAVIGGGIVGINTAYFLASQGKRIAILEAGRIVEATSGNTTAKVTALHGTIYDFLLDHFGKEKAQIYADSNQWAIQELELIIKKEKIDCNFARADAFTYTNKEEHAKEIIREFEAAKKLNLPVTYENNLSLLPFTIKLAVRIKNQALFHPRKYLLGLAQRIVKNEGLIFENTRVLNIKDGEPCEISTEKGTVKARDVVVATNYPIHDHGFFFARMNQVGSAAFAIKINGNLPDGMFLGIGQNELSIRPLEDVDNQWLIVGGLKSFVRLEKMIKASLPVKSFDYRWAAQDSSTVDRVPFIGRENPLSKHTFVITGFDEWGMTKSFVAGKLISDLILGHENPWSALYDPTRLNIGASVNKFIEHGKEVFEGYVHRFTVPGKEEIKKLKEGEGRVLDIDGRKVAVSKDKEGKIFAVSAVCMHMGCIVGWNSDEQTWDCPCHGSRYTREGKVINGPTVKPLAVLQVS